MLRDAYVADAVVILGSNRHILGEVDPIELTSMNRMDRIGGIRQGEVRWRYLLTPLRLSLGTATDMGAIRKTA